MNIIHHTIDKSFNIVTVKYENELKTYTVKKDIDTKEFMKDLLENKVSKLLIKWLNEGYSKDACNIRGIIYVNDFMKNAKIDVFYI